MILAAVALASIALPGAPVVSRAAPPRRRALDAAETGAIAVRNVGATRAVVAARAASVAVDARGRPRLVPRGAASRSAAEWLAITPRDFTLAPGARVVLDVEARTPRRAAPGDHHGVVLLSTRPPGASRVGVRVRMGVRVIVHVAGPRVRRLVVRGLRVRRAGRARTLELTVANRGNVTETPRPVATVYAGGRQLAQVALARRELLPGASAIADGAFRGPYRGPAIVKVELGRAVVTYRVRL